MPTATHRVSAHTRNGHPVRAHQAHHTPGQVSRAWKEAREDGARRAFAKAGYAIVVGGGLAVAWGTAAVLSVTAAAFAGITTVALGSAGVRKATRGHGSGRRRRPQAISGRRKRALRRHKAHRRASRAWRATRRTSGRRWRAARRAAGRGVRRFGVWARGARASIAEQLAERKASR